MSLQGQESVESWGLCVVGNVSLEECVHRRRGVRVLGKEHV